MSFLPTYLNHLAPVLREDLIRLGRKNDGGYVIPRYVFKECDTLLSLGICDDWSFDLQFKEHLPEITIHAYDHTTSRRQMEREKNSQFRKLFKGLKVMIPFFPYMRHTFKNGFEVALNR